MVTKFKKHPHTIITRETKKKIYEQSKQYSTVDDISWLNNKRTNRSYIKRIRTEDLRVNICNGMGSIYTS